MKMAAAPAGLATATPVKLFGGAGLQPDNVITGSPVFSPIGGAPAIQLNADLTQSLGGANLSDLDWCILAEPGLYANSGAVYMAIYCTDAQAATGEHYFQAPALVEKNSRRYLAVTPVNTTSGERYDGCRV